jgi:hypothetical protein
VTYNGGADPDLSELGNGLLDAERSNTLYPDGCYSEKERAPSYLSLGNANGFHGVISFWVKANHAPPVEVDPRGHPFLKWTHFSSGVKGLNSPDQFFYLGTGPSSSGAAVVCQFEVGDSLADTQMEHRFQLARALTSHQWSLVTMYYDFRSPNPPGQVRGGQDNCGELLLNVGIAYKDKGPSGRYGDGNNPVSASDITMPDIFGAHRLVLGAGRPLIEFNGDLFSGSGADSTFDELAIYDFGGGEPVQGGAGVFAAATSDTLASPGVLAARRYKDGRYYRESDYPASGGLRTAMGPLRNAAEYFSPPIRLGPCRIKALAWTQVVPSGLKAPLPLPPPPSQPAVDEDREDGDNPEAPLPLPPPPSQPGIDGDPDGGDNPGDGRILLELADISGGSYLDDASGKPIDRTYDRPALSQVERSVAAPFRLHAVFQLNLADKDNTTILDPLALDDVTVVYEPLGGRRITLWEESR